MTSSLHIFLTGGTGFFGRALLRTWQAESYIGVPVPFVTVLSRSPDAFFEQYPEFRDLPWLRLHRGDICNLDTLPHGIAYTHIVHAAADSTLGPQLTPLQRYDQIVCGTRNLLDFAVACAAERFLFISSGAVYGPQPTHLDQIPEDWKGMPNPLDPGNAYGVAKRSAEHLCALYNRTHRLHTVIARCFAFIGEDLPLDAHFAIGNFILDALRHDKIVVKGDGMPLRSYLDQRDLAEWLFTMLQKGESGCAYNVGSDQGLSIAEIAHLVRDIVSPGKPVHIQGDSCGNNGRNLYIPSIRRAKEELGLAVRIPLDAAIKATAEGAERRLN
ncbi:MAG: NAD-dependent epimerase/dehydratase family protein [Methylomicrobium sp.]